MATLSVVHSLRTRGLRSTLLFAASGNAMPILGELVAVNVLKVLRHHARPQVGGVPLAIVLGWVCHVIAACTAYTYARDHRVRI